MNSSSRPFRCAIPDDSIVDLHRRLDAARWPDALEDEGLAEAGWDYGIAPVCLRPLIDHWRHRFSWREAEARLNAPDQFKLAVDGLDVHFIHQRSPHTDALPLLMIHGWPGSIVEFLDVVPRLTEPERFGGRSLDAFHVICPSLPGYGFSDAARSPGMGPFRTAGRFLQLMTALGYDRFVAQGGDWGSIVVHHLAGLAPERLIGMHLNMLPPWRPRGVTDPEALMTAAEHERYRADVARREEITGYQAIQRTRPQTLAYGLADSPIGLAAWIGEKLRAWSDPSGQPLGGLAWGGLSFDQALTNISLYWFTNTIGSSIRFYREFALEYAQGRKPLAHRGIPTGGAFYPGEIEGAVKAWAELQYDLVHWHAAERGGHFAAFEQPDAFARDLRAFGAVLRGQA